MAQTKKTTKSKKTSANSSNSRSKESKLATRKRNEIRIEISFLFVVAIVLILFMGNIGVDAFLIKGMTYVFFGLFGVLEYIFPILVFVVAWLILANLGNDKVKFKIIYIASIFWIMCGLIQLGYYSKTFSYLYYFGSSARNKSGGGFMGGLLSKTLAMLLGRPGAYVILIAALLAMICLLTGKTFIRLLILNIKDGFIKLKETITREKSKRMELLVDSNKDDKIDFEDDLPNESKLNNLKSKISLTNLKDLFKDKESLDVEEPKVTQNTITFSTPLEIGNDKIQTNNSLDNIDSYDIKNLNKETSDIIEHQDDKVTRQDTKNETISLASKVENDTRQFKDYKLPPLNLLTKGSPKSTNNADAKEKAVKLNMILDSFGVKAHVVGYTKGPSVTQFEVQPDIGVKVKKISDLSDDIKLGLAVPDIRIEAPIPGKSVVGIEVPNETSSSVTLRDLLESEEFKNAKSKISFAVGRDIAGNVIVSDIAKLPHLLIGGSTGSGKSVFMNTLIMSVLYKATPDEVKFFMIDPKMIELSVYNKIPHLFVPVVTDPKKAAGVLNYAVVEMTKRYQLFKELNVKNLEEYNAKLLTFNKSDDGSSYIHEDKEYKKKPQIVIVVDEFADLMMVAKGEVEESVCRLAQLARAAGIHLILATQRPSVDVITGLIKANMTSRCALLVSSGVDSRTIIDQVGAEKLLGNGDMLYSPAGTNHPLRIQGAYVSGAEVESVVNAIVSKNGTLEVDESVENEINIASNKASNPTASFGAPDSDEDEYLNDAAMLIINSQKASVGMLQRKFKIGFNRAARIMDRLCELGVVGEEEGTKPRKVLMMSPNEYNQESGDENNAL